jgi:hypothetical protein
MKKIISINFLAIVFVCCLNSGCNDEFLKEKPLDFFSAENVFTNQSGFDAAIIGLHVGARDLTNGVDNHHESIVNSCTDVATDAAAPVTTVKSVWRTMNPTNNYPEWYWNWAYEKVIPRANVIINRAENPDVEWNSANAKNEIVAEARFFRGYAYSVLAWLFGGVPIIDTEETTPRYDYVRATKEEVLNFIVADLKFASENLLTQTEQDGRIVKATADHYLAETYLGMKQYDNAIQAASSVINSGLYKIMTERFGDLTKEGDVYSDLFATNKINRSSGNLETIWAIQIEYGVNGGIPGDGGNSQLRRWGPGYYYFKDPDGVPLLLVDSLNRPNGWITPTNYTRYEIWASDWDNDIRNSKYNIRRDYYYNNPKSKYFGQKIEIDKNGYLQGTNHIVASIDTMRYIFPTFRKLEGEYYGQLNGRSYKEFIKARLAETYLIRAEAYLMSGDKQKAADDINILRNRANATPVSASNVDLDYILDERARELICEERRLQTLNRMGNTVERIKKYNFREVDFIKDFHNLWPIPQSAIDANQDAVLEQNPGY